MADEKKQDRAVVKIRTEFIRLDGLLKFCGAAETGGHAKELILSGAVQVDGRVCVQRGRKVYPGSVIETGQREYEVVSG